MDKTTPKYLLTFERLGAPVYESEDDNAMITGYDEVETVFVLLDHEPDDSDFDPETSRNVRSWKLTDMVHAVHSYSSTQAALKALVEAAEIVLANATVIPDPAMKGSTDTYSVPLDDIEALKKALALAQEVLK